MIKRAYLGLIVFSWWIGALGSELARARELPSLQPVSVPVLDDFEPSVRQQLEESQGRIERLMAEAGEREVDLEELARAFGETGRLYLFYDRPEAAAACLTNAVTLDPGAFDAWYLLATIHQGEGRFEAAVAAFGRALELRPGDLPSVLRLAETHYRQRRLEESAELYRRALELTAQPDHPSADGAMAEVGLGRIASSKRRWQEAVEHYRRALELQPESDTTYHPLGLALRHLGEIEDAKAALAKAGNNMPTFEDPLIRDLYLETRSARSFVFEGNRARRRGLSKLAIENYYQALELDPKEPTAHYNLGVVLGGLGHVAQAEFHFRQATIHEPAHRNAWFNLAIGWRARGRLVEAIDAFSEVIALDAEDYDARLELAVTQFAAGRRQQGIEGLLAVWNERPEEVDVLLSLARYLEQTGAERTHSIDLSPIFDRAAEKALTPEQARRVTMARAEHAAKARPRPRGPG